MAPALAAILGGQLPPVTPPSWKSCSNGPGTGKRYEAGAESFLP